VQLLLAASLGWAPGPAAALFSLTLTLPLPSSHRFGDDFRTLGFAFRTLGFAVRVSLPDREGRPGNWYLPTN
jgi:hypothetical protein